jgi:hypothetical protein
MNKDEALDLALEALELNNLEWKALADSGDCGYWNAEDQDHYKQTNQAITAIKQARLAPVQEPVFCEYCGGNDDADFGLPTDHCTDCARPQPAPVQEPVATDWERIARVQDAKLRAMCNDPTAFEQLCEIMDRYEALRPTPPAAQRQWGGLNWEDMPDIRAGDHAFLSGARWAEAKLKEKNT